MHIYCFYSHGDSKLPIVCMQKDIKNPYVHFHKIAHYSVQEVPSKLVVTGKRKSKPKPSLSTLRSPLCRDTKMISDDIAAIPYMGIAL